MDNRDGNSGFSNSSETVFSMVDGKLAVNSGNAVHTYSKMVSDPSNAIVGCWYLNVEQVLPDTKYEIALIMLPDEKFYCCCFSTASGLPSEIDSILGVEYGSYTWNPATSRATFIASVDNNDLNGVCNLPASYLFTVSNGILNFGEVDNLAQMTRIGQ